MKRTEEEKNKEKRSLEEMKKINSSSRSSRRRRLKAGERANVLAGKQRVSSAGEPRDARLNGGRIWNVARNIREKCN